jgi:hypothetical protein
MNLGVGIIGQLAMPAIIAAVGIYAVNKLLNSTEGGGEQSKDSQGSTVDKIKKEVEKKNLSYPDSWYAEKADYLQENLTKTWKNWEPAADCTKVILSLKTPDDWKNLIAVFGVREPRAWSNTYKGGNLQSWLRYFLEDVYYRSPKGEVSKTIRFIDVVNTFLKTKLKVNPI